jgi:hypothetical protein
MASTYTITRDQIIYTALRKLGVIELGDTPDAQTVANAALCLNLLIKQMSMEGLKMWKNTELIIPLTANQTTYILGGVTSTVMYDSLAPNTLVTDKPLKAIQGFYRNNQNPTFPIDVPLLLVSKEEYNRLGSKFSTGTANTVFYDVKRLNGVLYVYLTPDAQAQTNLQLHLVAQMPLNDISLAGDIPDFPTEWMNCLVWSLADLLSMEYGVPMNYRQEIAQRAAAYRDQATSWDVEYSPTFFSPDFRSTNNSSYT